MSKTKMYRIGGWGKHPIEEIEVVKETECFVTVLHKSNGNGTPFERRYAKDGKVFKTFDEAKQAIIDNKQRDVENYRRLLESANGALGNAKGLKNPYESNP